MIHLYTTFDLHGAEEAPYLALVCFGALSMIYLLWEKLCSSLILAECNINFLKNLRCRYDKAISLLVDHGMNSLVAKALFYILTNIPYAG